MNIFFEKVPFEEYLAFFKTEATVDSEYERWIRIQYDYLKAPSWDRLKTFEVYSPSNFSLSKGSSFVIPTGFRYVKDCSEIQCIPCFGSSEIKPFAKEDAAKHIVIRGITKENHCFQAGDRLIKLIIEE